MKPETTPHRLDVKAFAQSSGAMAGQNLLSEYQRLVHETQGLGAQEMLNWSARGELRTDATGNQQVWLHLNVEVKMLLTCQRCMTPAEIPVIVNRSFRFVSSEDVAEAEDAESEEDVLALDTDFSLAALIEEEVLMELPLIPKHNVCPVVVKLTAADPCFQAAAMEKQQPFTVLAQLKRRNSD